MPTNSARSLQPPPAPGSLCLLRLSALGDVTHVLPLVHTLRNAWPGIRLTWVIGRGEHRLLAGLSGVSGRCCRVGDRCGVGGLGSLGGVGGLLADHRERDLQCRRGGGEAGVGDELALA